jgi:hypothetical protein
MLDSSVDRNLESLERSTPEPLNAESSADPSLEPYSETVLEPIADDVWVQSNFESENFSINYSNVKIHKIIEIISPIVLIYIFVPDLRHSVRNQIIAVIITNIIAIIVWKLFNK